MVMLVAAAALMNDVGQVLMAQRPADKQHGSLWEFPGGKVEPDETPAIALVRELEEELGIHVAIDDLEPVAFSESPGARPLVLMLYRCRRWRGEPRAIDVAAVAWMAIDDLVALAMPPADYPLAAALAAAKR